MQIPLQWQSILETVQIVCPEAFIGGGCLRDLDNRREIEDIDIFVRGDKANMLDNVRSALIARGTDVEEIDPEKMYPVGDGNDVVGHFEAQFDGESLPVQIIMVDWDTSRICERFDFGICRIAFDGKTLTRTQEYEDDKINQVFRLCRQRTDAEMVASVHRFARLSRKYEGWPFALFQQPEDGFDFD